MNVQLCEFVCHPEGKRSRFFCESHSLECVEELSPSSEDPTRRVAHCPVSGDLAGYVDTRPTPTATN